MYSDDAGARFLLSRWASESEGRQSWLYTLDRRCGRPIAFVTTDSGRSHWTDPTFVGHTKELESFSRHAGPRRSQVACCPLGFTTCHHKTAESNLGSCSDPYFRSILTVPKNIGCHGFDLSVRACCTT
jgi:hypothetical protein